MKRPNILWICSDQQRFDTLACYGNEFVKTPNLDALAESGMLFENAFSQSPVCSPSRAAFLTGRYPRTCRMRQNGADIPAGEVLVTKMLADEGYLCGLSGKLHLSVCNPSVCETMERRIDDGYSAFHWSHHSGPGWGNHNEYWRWLSEKGEEFKTDASNYIDVSYGPDVNNHQSTWCIEKAMDFINASKKGGEPWLFSINMFDPHHDFDAPKERVERFMDVLDDIPLPNYVEGELDNKPKWQMIDNKGPYAEGLLHDRKAYYHKSDIDHRMIKASYWASCEIIDEQVGRLIQNLKDTGQYENTVIIYSSDHGEMLGDHGIYLKGAHFYDCAIKVPLIISWPGVIRQGRSTAMVELLDLAQTVLDAIGVEHHPGMQGRSLWPLLTGCADTDYHRDDVYCECYNSCGNPAGVKPFSTMLRTKEYKLVVEHGLNTGELYDLKNDPDETFNQWDKPEYSTIKSEMLMKLCHRMAFTVDPLPPRKATF